MINININEFDYDLPKERIAKFPLEDRTKSKLLVFKEEAITHSHFFNISEFLDKDYILIKNSTKVIFARILVKKQTGGKAEILCVEPISPSNDPQITLLSNQECTWKCIIGGKKITNAMILNSDNEKIKFSAEILEKNANNAIVKFKWEENYNFAQILDLLGEVPLPPYLERDSIEKDKTDYQTVYAQKEGSIAAPTAGLHFDNLILQKLSEKEINSYDLVLHVGPGTFLPVSSEDIANHVMHEEQIILEKQTLESILSELMKGKKIIATGTTTLRTLESIFWYGYNIIKSEDRNFNISQWGAYQESIDDSINFSDTLNAIIDYHKNDDLIKGKTSIILVPGYKFRTATALITNFHQPKSTLLLLISAFIGNENRKKVYSSAMENNYRFLSYGDSSILFK